MEDVAGGIRVHLGERAIAHAVTGTEHLEEVEFEVPQVALVVRHDPHPRFTICFTAHRPGSLSYSPVT